MLETPLVNGENVWRSLWRYLAVPDSTLMTFWKDSGLLAADGWVMKRRMRYDMINPTTRRVSEFELVLNKVLASALTAQRSWIELPDGSVEQVVTLE